MEGPFSLLEGHEQLVFGNDPDCGLRCIIAIHSTKMGPSLGGTRFYPYESEEDALRDVLRLSRAMTYKAACAGVDTGGGKAVIIGDPAVGKSEILLRAYGRVVESLRGRYVTACDVGTTADDMGVIRRETRWVTGAHPAHGGSGDSGVMTALGTYRGIKACAERVWGNDRLANRHVAVQGIGKVGRHVVENLHAEGARLSVADVDESAVAWAVEHAGAEAVAVDKIHGVDADIFSPNALGGVIGDHTIPELQCKVVAGAANNQLVATGHSAALADAGILYAPDFVINAGGLIQVANELHPDGYNAERTRQAVEQIAHRLHDIFDEAERTGNDTGRAAERVAEERIAALARLRGFLLP